VLFRPTQNTNPRSYSLAFVSHSGENEIRMQTSSPLVIATGIVVFVLFFVTVWCAALFVISRVSGWALLATRFRTDSPFPGQTWTWQSARLRWGCNYNNCLTFGSDPSGLYLSMMFIFSIGSPPLLIPWPEVTFLRRRQFLFFRFVEFRLGREQQVPLMIREKLAESVRGAAGASWPVEPVS
jgi:hypothetical protein